MESKQLKVALRKIRDHIIQTRKQASPAYEPDRDPDVVDLNRSIADITEVITEITEKVAAHEAAKTAEQVAEPVVAQTSAPAPAEAVKPSKKKPA